MIKKRRVVVTGLGVVSPVGTGVPKFWDAIIKGKNGIRRISTFDPSQFSSQIAGEVTDFHAEHYFNPKEARNLSTFIQFAVAASREAVAHGQLDLKNIDLNRMGVLIGSGIGSLRTIELAYQRYTEKGASKISPFFIPRIIINEAAGQVSIDTGARNCALCVTTACATGTNAIGDAFRMIQYGDADIMLAGGAESAISPLSVGGFAAAKALSSCNDQPEKASRPFDLNRDGFIIAEGAGIALLETLEHAQKRGAPILAELVGYGRTSDAFHITAPEPSGTGAINAMAQALNDANLKPADVNYINAHGTSTKLNDKVETLAIKNVFGDQAKNVAVNSTKSMIGHLLGAAGGVEFAATVLTVQNNLIHPTVNYETPDPDCDLDYVPNEARTATVNVAMSNSLGFGGHNATLVIKKFQE